MQLNVQGFLSSIAEIQVMLDDTKPEIVCLTETHLQQYIKMPILHGYTLVSRLDRRTDQKVVHVGDSKTAERSWHILHTNSGAVLLGVWYRPPARGEIASIRSLEEEFEEFGEGTVGTVLVGDMNVHERTWLRYSNGTSLEGRELQNMSVVHGLEQLIREPTRLNPDHLLDHAVSRYTRSC